MYAVSSSLYDTLPLPFIIFEREDDALRFCREISGADGEIDDIFVDREQRLIYRITEIYLPTFNHAHLTAGEIHNDFENGVLTEREMEILRNMAENELPEYQTPPPTYRSPTTPRLTPAPRYDNNSIPRRTFSIFPDEGPVTPTNGLVAPRTPQTPVRRVNRR